MFLKVTSWFGLTSAASKNRVHVLPDFGYETRNVSSGWT